jgi:hypothetical protein
VKRQSQNRTAPITVLLLISVFALALTGTFFAGGGDADAQQPFRVTKVEIPGMPDKVPPDTSTMKVDATFSLAFDPQTINANSLYIEKINGTKVAAKIQFYNNDAKRVSLHPLNSLQENTEYRVVFTSGIKTQPIGFDEYKIRVALEPKTVTFKTAIPPTITDRKPAPGAEDVALDINVFVQFDRQMDTSSINTKNFYLREGGTQAIVPASVIVNVNYYYRIIPKENLKPNTQYTVILNGGSDGAKDKNGVPLVASWMWTFKTAGSATTPFIDVKPGDDYYGAIVFLAGVGAISGYPDNTYRPKNPLWRAQFAKMIVNTLGYPVTEGHFPHAQVPFTDLGPDNLTDLYPHEYVSVCYLKGITKGSDPNDPTKFSPYDDIPRYQVISMVVRAAQDPALGLLTAKPGPNYGKWRHDPIHGANAAWAEINGLLAGLDLDKLDPWGKMTRGETAQVLYNLYKMVH